MSVHLTAKTMPTAELPPTVVILICFDHRYQRATYRYTTRLVKFLWRKQCSKCLIQIQHPRNVASICFANNDRIKLHYPKFFEPIMNKRGIAHIRSEGLLCTAQVSYTTKVNVHLVTNSLMPVRI